MASKPVSKAVPTKTAKALAAKASPAKPVVAKTPVTPESPLHSKKPDSNKPANKSAVLVRSPVAANPKSARLILPSSGAKVKKPGSAVFPGRQTNGTSPAVSSKEKGSLNKHASLPTTPDSSSLAFYSAPNLLEDNIFDPGLLRNDEVYDETDQAQHLQLLEQAEIIRRAREMNRPQTHPDFDGVHCVDCDIEIPPRRLAATGSVRCVDCQQHLETTTARRF